jgi:WD40 repeat protein
MTYFERRLVRPSVHDLVASLDEASRAANAGQALPELDHDHWERFVCDIRAQPEGVEQWHQDSRPAGVGLAWWTDSLSRRHFRVWAGPASDGNGEARPAVWHIAPERVVSRLRQGRRDWLAVCPCGACGAPEAIGWTGDRCGRCHQGGAHPPPAVLTDVHQRIDQLVFSPDGHYLAAAGAGRVVRLWDVAAREQRAPLYSPHAEVRALTFAPGSQLLAIAAGDRMLRFFDVDTREEVRALPAPCGARLVVLAPDDRTLVMAGEKETEVWGRPDWYEPWRLVHSEQRPIQAACFSRSCDDLVWADSAALRLSRFTLLERGGRPCPRWGQLYHGDHFECLGFCPDRVTLSAFGFDREAHQAASRGRSTGRVRRVRLSDGGALWTLEIWSLLSCPRFSPDGECLAGLLGAAVSLYPLGSRHGEVRLEAAPRVDLTALAFSPDGQTLAVAGVDGTVRLWPWRRLLTA